MIKHILVLLFTALLVGCGNSKEVEIPDDLIPTETFVGIMIDVQLTEGMNSQRNYGRTNSPSTRSAHDPYSEIFEKHGVNAEEFKRTYDFYSHNPGKMEVIYEHVLDSLNKLDVEIKQKFTREERALNDSIKKVNQKKNDSIRALPRPGLN